MNQIKARKLPFHYGWVIVATGALIIAACLGFGRFALGMLLPAMGENLHLSYSQMGLISTANFCGYVAAVIVSAALTSRLGARRLIVTGLALVSGSMLAVSQANSFLSVLLLYTLTGFGSGAANVPIMALVSHWFRPSLRGRAAGFIVGGSGLAIIISGLLIPAVNSALGEEGWRGSWMILGLASTAIMIAAALLIRNNPAEMASQPLGVEPPITSNTKSTAASPRAIITHLGFIYLLFGYAYVIYATFIVTTLVQERGFSEATAGQFWMWVGAFSLVSGPLFGALSDHLGRKLALITVLCLQGVAYLLVALSLPTGFLYLSVFLFGISAWGTPAIMAAAIGDYLGPQKAAAALGSITLFFGVGQIIGPGIAGILADITGSFAWSYAMGSGMAVFAVLLCLGLRKPG